MRTCDQHPLVTVSVTGEAREDGGGLSGPQLVRLQLAYEGGTGPVQMVAKFGDWGDKQAMPAWPWQIRLIQVVGNLPSRSNSGVKSFSTRTCTRTCRAYGFPGSIMSP